MTDSLMNQVPAKRAIPGTIVDRKNQNIKFAKGGVDCPGLSGTNSPRMPMARNMRVFSTKTARSLRYQCHLSSIESTLFIAETLESFGKSIMDADLADEARCFGQRLEDLRVRTNLAAHGRFGELQNDLETWTPT